MRTHLIIFLIGWMLFGCASIDKAQISTDSLWQDQLFEPLANSAAVPTPAKIFALTPAMRRALQTMPRGQHRPLVEFLQQDGQVQYDSRLTRDAAATFASSSGNCMSLVVMTAALAKANGIGYRYQLVQAPPVWDRQGGVYLINGHVNIRLQSGSDDTVFERRGSTVDFLPGNQIRGYQIISLSESQLLARYYNNLAAEALVQRRYQASYQLLKAAHQIDPQFVQLWNTLGVLYRRVGAEAQAERVYRYAIELAPTDVIRANLVNNALHNLALLLSSQNRLQEWQQVHARLELNRLANPYYYFDMGEAAYRGGDYQQALRYYRRALDLAEYRHEFHFGISRAYFRNGQLSLSERHMRQAHKLAPQNEKQRYQLKLAALRSG